MSCVSSLTFVHVPTKCLPRHHVLPGHDPVLWTVHASSRHGGTHLPSPPQRLIQPSSPQIPTFHLKLSTLYPSTRNDPLFLSTFFLTRLLFHAYMITSFVPSPSTNPILSYLGIGAGKTLMHSPVPAWLNAAAFPLHLTWFIGAMKGYRRRRRRVAGREAVPKRLSVPPVIEAVCP